MAKTLVDLKIFDLNISTPYSKEEENKFSHLSLSNKKLPLNLSTFIPKSDVPENSRRLDEQ
jgi:hypothetical protein